MQQMPMNAPHHLQNGPSHLNSNHLQHHPQMGPHGKFIIFLKFITTTTINILFIFLGPPHAGMQMQPMPPMGYQGHQMPPNVSSKTSIGNRNKM